MSHADAIAGRLPELYRDGELLRGVIGAAALQTEILDEIMLEVQRAHWFGTTFELSEAARLAALLDFAPEPWQDLPLFRLWVDSLRDAMLGDGAVTRRALTEFVAAYAAGYEQARKVRVVGPIDRWGDEPSSTAPALVENPRRVVFITPSVGAAGLEPLQQLTFTVKGLDAAEPAFELVGLLDGPECAPVIVNLTTGAALLFLDRVPAGQRLFLRPDGEGGMTARLEQRDVSDKLVSLRDVTPGEPWPRANVESPAKSMSLARGDNELWFLPVAHYDVPGLDRFLLALPDLLLAEGRFDETSFDTSLFFQAPAVVLRALWRESRPASFEVHLPGGLLLAPAGGTAQAVGERGRLADSLDEAVNKLRAAGIESAVKLRPFGEVQRANDHLTAVLPMRVRGQGPTGADRLSNKGGLFEVTGFDDSTFR